LGYFNRLVMSSEQKEITYWSSWKKWPWTTKTAFALSLLGFIFMILFSLMGPFNDWSFSIDTEIADHFGSLIGGVVGSLFSLAGFLLLYETIIKQQESFQIQQFENKYFELIKIHRENVQSIKYKVPDSTDDKIVSGHGFFVQLNEEFDKLYDLIVDFKISSLSEIDRIEITSIILFYGVSPKSERTLKDALNKYDTEIVDDIIKNLRKVKTDYDANILFFGGHQNRLDHYLRHFAQTIKYIDRTVFLNESQKYNYAKLIRAQLTQFELSCFFYNTLTKFGKSWREYLLVEKYQLIKNLPRILTSGIQPEKYYPKINYDYKKNN